MKKMWLWTVLCPWAVSSAALAAIVNPAIPAWRGAPNATFSGWESFTSAYAGPNAPDQPGSSLASLFNFGPGAFLTGSGNIYGSSSPLVITVEGGILAAPNVPLEVVLNVGTIGTFLDDDSVVFTVLTYAGEFDFAPDTVELRHDAPIPGFGSIQTRAYRWDLAAAGLDAVGYRISFRSQEINMSLDGVTVDIRFVPVPGLALVPLAGLVAGRRRR